VVVAASVGFGGAVSIGVPITTRSTFRAFACFTISLTTPPSESRVSRNAHARIFTKADSAQRMANPPRWHSP
jgi:hypothetical protein